MPDCYKIQASETEFKLNKELVKAVCDFVQAAEFGREDDVQKYIQSGYSLDYLTFNNFKFKLINKDNDKELFELVDKFYQGPQSALITAAQFGRLGVVKILLDAKANINIQDWCGRTALMAACYAGEEKVVDLLLKRKADVNINNDGFTALRCAGQAYIDFEVKKRILTKLLKASAKPEIGEPFYEVNIELKPEELKNFLEQHQKHSADN